MKFTLVALLVFVAYAHARVVEEQEITSAYNYLAKSVVLADKRRKAEEEFITQRVIGGSDATLELIPYQAGLHIHIPGVGTGVCGASLVSATKLITAAHCWFDGINQAGSLTVRLGTVLIFGTDGITITTNTVRTHPNWFPWLVRNDVAVVDLPTSVTFTNNVAPISLPSESELNENFAGVTATISGYGLTSLGVAVSQSLQYNNNLTVMTNEVCTTNFLPILVQPSNICTSGVGIVGACNGDSGGPLALNINDRNVLIGIVSFGPPPAQGGCTAGRPSVYARVTSFTPWFQSQM